MEELFCIGCGAQIQTEDKEKAGFTPASSCLLYTSPSPRD